MKTKILAASLLLTLLGLSGCGGDGKGPAPGAPAPYESLNMVFEVTDSRETYALKTRADGSAHYEIAERTAHVYSNINGNVTNTTNDTIEPRGYSRLTLDRGAGGIVRATSDELSYTTVNGREYSFEFKVTGDTAFLAGRGDWDGFLAGRPVALQYTDQGIADVKTAVLRRLKRALEVDLRAEMGPNARIGFVPKGMSLEGAVITGTIDRMVHGFKKMRIEMEIRVTR